MLQKTEGDVFVFEHEVNIEDMQIKSRIGVVFQNSMLDDLLSVKENLEVRASFYGLSKDELTKRINEIDGYLNLGSFLDQRYGKLSGGQKRKSRHC